MADPLTIGLMVGSTLLSAVGQMNAGTAAQQAADAQQQQANYQAAQMDQQAGQERAASQREFYVQKQKKDLAESKAMAINAAGGGSSLDPSVVNILGDLESEGTYNEKTALYQGEDKARNLESGADLARYQGVVDHVAGENEKAASNIKVASTLLSGGSSMLDKYGDASLGSTTVNWNDGTSGTYRNTGQYLL